jgi:hypothetical protein
VKKGRREGRRKEAREVGSEEERKEHGKDGRNPSCCCSPTLAPL